MNPQSDERFWSSTRGRIVALIRAADRTVNELAEALKVTDNAIRAHLTALERDGLVRQSGSRGGTRKPNLTYALTPEADRLFPREYAAVLGYLLAELKTRHPPAEVLELVRAVGRRMATDFRPAVEAAAGASARPTRALEVLRDLGGFCQSEERAGATVLSCTDCPLAAVVAAHPEACRLVESLLAAVLGVPVRERCQPPRCEFEVAAGNGSVPPPTK